ncbi:ABC transporter substrate-binding protein [Endozoicomonas sp. SCSIO W0465]|uniref:ABC transporter substrate-binding protein n=1 Tax=Endozoicomonas sp. SCSIO W0465 TaxID=2918516 RepID=UPI002074D713|nr:ABC transporter substrate-binding protein [Endozoicomonas sp. SCSIO W0465]USE38655.1 ABC transporter substrate-binding protein [Endozoicomonas sp. SCSIO W0465]
MQRNTTRQWVAILTAALLLSGCSGPWNDPNPATNPEETTYFGSFITRPKHLDPVRSYSAEEGLFLDQIYEPPLQYHFLKRPYELQPATAAAMPVLELLDENLNPLPEDSREAAYSRITIRLKPDTFYQPHPALARDQQNKPRYFFNNSQQGDGYKLLSDFPVTGTRELNADDYIYQIKRMADPLNKSPLIGLMSDYIVGMKDFGEWAKATRIDDQWLDLRRRDIEGLEKIDDLTFSIRINGIYPQFQYWLAMRFFAPVPWEADRFYHNPGFADKNLVLDWNPIGTGPFMMTVNSPNREIVLERNPNYRRDYYPSEGSGDDAKRGYLADAGKQLPFIDKAIFRYEKAATSMWSKFVQGYYDRSGDGDPNINTATFDQAFTVGPDGLELTPELEQRDIIVDEEIRPSLYYTGFNMLDPVVGGYTEDKRKLRQAISIVYNDQEYIDIFRNGIGQVAQGPIPPGLYGYAEGKEATNPFIFDWDESTGTPKRKSVEYARQLLAEAGYPNGRHHETGKPLILYMDTTAADSSPRSDWIKKQLAQIDVQLEFRTTDYPRFKEKMRQGNTQMFGWGWLADYPDPENFLFLLDSRQGLVKCQCDGSNSTNYDNPEFDQLYDKVKALPNGPERLSAINRMVEIVQQDSPWIWGFNNKDYYLSNQWVFNTKRHGISQGTLKYLRLDPELRQQKQEAWNRPVVWPLMASVGLLVLLVVPGVRAYRRRQKLTIRTKP